MSTYIGIIHKDNESDYGVSFPDFPGCITAGYTIEEAKTMAYEALLFHIEGMLEDGERLPLPSSPDEIVKNKAFTDGIAFLLVSIPDSIHSNPLPKAA